MRVVVTGGSGFIGSHVVDRLLAGGHEPRIFDLRESPHHSPDEVDTVIGDLLDPDILRAAIEGCDAVIHLAAAADVGLVAAEPERSERVNARGTLAVLEAARATGIGRVIYGSTIWVYGESGDGVIDEEAPLRLPRHLYTASKLAGEMYCTSYAELYDVPFTILRFGIPYGPRARPSAVIPIFVRKALAREPLTIAGDGAQGRRFTYVEDIADGVVRALAPCAENRVYNLAGNQTVTIRELAETVQGLTEKAEIVHTRGRSGDFAGAEISSRRAAEELGWHASTPLRVGVRRYLEWLTADSPAPVSPGVPEPAPVPAEQRPALVPSPRRRRPSLASTFGDPSTVALACAAGTLIPYAMALGMDERFDKAQVHAVGLTTLMATLIGLLLIQSATLRRLRAGLTSAVWLVAFYFTLEALPWPRHALDIALPEIQTLVLSMLGVLMAVAAAIGVNRWRRDQAAPDEAI
jgi:UDP-glucose 4-epimerase